MAVESNASTEFGRVSRAIGVAFEYLLAGATMVGIISLAVLLVYVVSDAVRPLSAEPGWHLTFGVTLIVPVTLLGSYLYWRRTSALMTGASILGTLTVSLLFAGGLAAVFVDVLPPLLWLSYLLAGLIPVVTAVALTYVDWQVPFVARVAMVGIVGILSILGVPQAVPGVPGIYSLAEQVLLLPYVPADWLILVATLGGPVALLVGRRAARWGQQTGWTAAAIAFAVIGAAPFVGPLVDVGPLPATIVAAVALVPTGAFVAVVLVERPADRIGLAFPAVVVAGAFLGVVAVDVLGFAGPQTWLDWAFVTGTDQASLGAPDEAGIYPAIVGTILLMVVVALLSFPLGVGAAVYLEEYAPDSQFKRIVDVNISNLAGVPSVVYGLLGLGVFVRYGGMTPGTVLVGGATLALLILPIIIIASREAIRGVPDSMRQASYGMGSTRWQTVRNVVLPEAFPGILTGTILALGRAIGETAPLLVIGAPQIFGLPTTLDSPVGALPLQLYVWATTFASEAFWTTALAAGVVTLLAAMLTMNSIAIVLRNRFQRDTQT